MIGQTTNQLDQVIGESQPWQFKTFQNIKLIFAAIALHWYFSFYVYVGCYLCCTEYLINAMQ